MRSSKLLLAVLTLTLVGSISSASGVSAATDLQPNRIRIEYIAPTSPAHQQIYEMVKERRALEKMQEIYGAFRLPAVLLLRTVGCEGASNAWYQRGRVTVCYEYLYEIWKMMPAEITPAGITPDDAIVGQFFYVLSHEMGHAVFDLLDVPVLGRQEDAADQFAAYIMLQFGKDQARRLITGAAHSYKNFVTHPSVTAPLAAFSGAHSPPAARFYNMLCLAYGADADLFADLVAKNYLPKDRANGCRKEYGEIVYAFKKLISPHLDTVIAQQVLQKEWLPRDKARSRP
jgi:hypothetical protein